MCEWGTHRTVHLGRPMPTSGRMSIAVDACIAELVQALNDAGVHTIGCCCGHGKGPGSVLYIQDGHTFELFLNK